jgi:putative Mg2+ transporter-C (MgtC) family protein
MISFPTLLLRLAVALVLGALVGLEREQKERGAGMRTLALVSLGSALFTIISAYGFITLLAIPRITLDPTRIASYIVAGIGFLGAGTIFLSRESDKVKGLTTAAAIWVMAAVGMTCGAGLLWEAFAATVMTLLVLFVFRYIEQLIVPRISSSQHHIEIEAKSITGPFIAKVYETCAQHGVKIEQLRIDTAQESDHIELFCQIAADKSLADVISDLRSLPGVSAIRTDAQNLSTDSKASSSKK